jgi:uncharacterized protein (TIGR02996 family)
MSDENALLRAILDDPDDDAPRLIYADWLEEHGDPARAAFIRAQIALERLPHDDPGRGRLVQIERTLWKAHRGVWKAWVPNWARVDRFRRGFLEEIRCDAADFLAGADAVRRQTPLLAVRLDRTDDLAVALFRGRALDGLRALHLGRGVPSIAWAVFAECPYLGRLVRLEVGSTAQPDRFVQLLIASPALPALQQLRLNRFSLGDEGALMLAAHPWISRLRLLDLSDNLITEIGGRAFIASAHMDALESLNLQGNPMTMNRLIVAALQRHFGPRVKV